MAENSKEDITKKTAEQVTKETRRAFIKKAVYAAPTLVALGSLSHPTTTEAEGFGPSEGPSGGVGGGNGFGG